MSEPVEQGPAKIFVRLGYCKLCRMKEIELYMHLAETDELHIEACEMAGCKHPPGYDF